MSISILRSRNKVTGLARAMDLNEWIGEPERLRTELSFLDHLMEEDRIKWFAPIMPKVIQRFLLEVDITVVEKRGFSSSGRTLNFGYDDLELDERESKRKNDDPKTER